MNNNTYTPVAYEFREAIAEALTKSAQGKIFFFNSGNNVDDATGMITRYEEIPGSGWFITIANTTSDITIRIDRIITLFGKPGPACDEFYAHGDVCLECTGGYDL